MMSPRGKRYIAIAVVCTIVVLMFMITDGPKTTAKGYLDQYLDQDQPRLQQAALKRPGQGPQYLPEPVWVPPPVKDPFLSLSTSREGPPIPEWNQPNRELHVKYEVAYGPPLLIGFTRAWPLLLQTVVSYITAGWPANQIYVIENTGAQRSNAKGQLTLQNPFYMNHEHLEKLGVNVIQAPVLMTFAQLQNYYIYLSHQYQWPQYFWSHQDVLALSYEDGKDSVTPKAHEEGYKSIYELALQELNKTSDPNERWGKVHFNYDNLALVNREAFEDVGGFDTFIPYYMTECDMDSRLLMGNWSIKDAHIGIINDVSATLDDLRVLYRDESVEPSYTDPNPEKPHLKARDLDDTATEPASLAKRDPESAAVASDPTSLTYFRKIARMAAHMQKFKLEGKNRNKWQGGQRGGKDEPYHYPTRGFAQGIDVLTAAGREVFAEKWGHQTCDLIAGAKLKLNDQWRVARDWQ